MFANLNFESLWRWVLCKPDDCLFGTYPCTCILQILVEAITPIHPTVIIKPLCGAPWTSSSTLCCMTCLNFGLCWLSSLAVPVTFEEADIASLPPPPSPQEEGAVEEKEVTTPTTSASSMMHLNLNVTRIFRRKKKKRQEPGKVLCSIKKLTSV